MDIKPYLVRKNIIQNMTSERPYYVQAALHSLYRPVTVYDKPTDEPETRGLTKEED